MRLAAIGTRSVRILLLVVSAALFAGAAKAQTPAEMGYDAAGFRVEKVRVAGGSEVVTIFAKHDATSEIPLVSVLRDTLGDDRPENDRLRYVWLHTYTRPSLRQKIGSFVPFLYSRTSNKGRLGNDPPPAVIDVQASDKVLWNQVLWTVFRKLIIGNFGVGIRASASQGHHNRLDYQKIAIAGALATLSLYQEASGDGVLTQQELKDIQARLFLSDKTFGWHIAPENFTRVFEKQRTLDRDYRGHNWELLRQYAEAQGLYFDPLEMPDGSARHALVWTTVEDVAANKDKKFERRFLNFRSPWGDKTLENWKGYRQERWFDADDREVDAATPGAKKRTMIPLALYGLDNPKIPMILIDFRDSANPKFREMSKRVLDDVTNNVLALSQFSSFPYFFGRFLYDLLPGRRGLDINQSSRLRSYAQLKLLLSLENDLDPDLSKNIAASVEHATLNPLENDTDVEARIARRQYANLMAYVARPDGLPAQISRDRREEMVRISHGPGERMLYSIAHAATFGAYTHREPETPAMLAKMDTRRQLDFHERYVREVAMRSANPEIDSDVAGLKRSLIFISEHGEDAGGKTAKAIAKVFKLSNDDDMRTLCLAGLYRINDSAAKNQLLAVYKDGRQDDRWRGLSAHYLKLALREGQRISKRDAPEIAVMAATDN